MTTWQSLEGESGRRGTGAETFFRMLLRKTHPRQVKLHKECVKSPQDLHNVLV